MTPHLYLQYRKLKTGFMICKMLVSEWFDIENNWMYYI